MKKIINAIAALAMMMAFAGCEIDLSFSEHTETIHNSKERETAYYITSVEQISGEDVVEVSLATGSSAEGNVLTLTSKKEGDSVILLKSSVHGKKATVTVNVGSTGAIYGTSALQYTTFNGTGDSSSTSKWEDDTSIKLNPAADEIYYVNASDEDEVLLVKGNILYLMRYDEPGTVGEFYDWARGVAEQTTANTISKINWFTYGRVMAANLSKKMKADSETRSSNSVSTSGLTGNNLVYTYTTVGNKQITIGSKTFTEVTDFGDWDWPTTWEKY